uniref:DUF11 domain-containing protein n=1 Tax=candidate division CPR3 bacterium TaxID=2268181 RepID=A0A7C4M2L4_UNCC3
MNKKRKAKIILSLLAFMAVFVIVATVLAAQTYNYTDNYTYPNGILVFTRADNSLVTGESGNAAITKGSEIKYYIEVTNQGSIPKTTNLKFTIPNGYIFDPVTAGISCTGGLSPCGNPTPGGTITGNGTNSINWNGVIVPAGKSEISFKLKT